MKSDVPYKMKIEIPGVPKLMSNRGGNWRAHSFERKKWRKRVNDWLMFESKPEKPLKKAGIRLTRCTSRASDFDNRVSAFKPCVDALVDRGILSDDSDNVIVERYYPFEKVANKESKIKIEVWEINDEMILEASA